jgi:FlgD Ig-like domain
MFSRAIAATTALLICGWVSSLGAAPVDGILSPYPPGPDLRLASKLELASGATLSGVRWYNNDSSSTPDALVLCEGVPGNWTERDRLSSPEARSSAWLEWVFPEDVTVGGEDLYVVFEWPAYQERTGEGPGTGAGLGYHGSEAGSPGLVSADGIHWLDIDESVHLAVEAVVGGASKSGLARETARPRSAISVFPNPANPAVAVSFELGRPGDARVRVFDARGRLVRTLTAEGLGAGPYELSWNGTDQGGESVSSGVYHLEINVQGVVHSKTVTLVR